MGRRVVKGSVPKNSLTSAVDDQHLGCTGKWERRPGIPKNRGVRLLTVPTTLETITHAQALSCPPVSSQSISDGLGGGVEVTEWSWWCCHWSLPALNMMRGDAWVALSAGCGRLPRAQQTPIRENGQLVEHMAEVPVARGTTLGHSHLATEGRARRERLVSQKHSSAPAGASSISSEGQSREASLLLLSSFSNSQKPKGSQVPNTHLSFLPEVVTNLGTAG